jgi:hypothetical protein
MMRKGTPSYSGESLGAELRPARWTYASHDQVLCQFTFRVSSMLQTRIVTENQLDDWVRGNSREAQGLIVELVWRLVAASSPKPNERRFPRGDSIGQPGPDAGDKATRDYRKSTAATPDAVRRDSAFIFVTPLSGRRGWEYTRKESGQAKWLADRRQRHDWHDVHVIDGSGLIDWLHHIPAVEHWLATAMGIPAQQMQTPEL